MSLVEDFSAFFNTAEFAVSATYNGAAAVKVIFDASYLESLNIYGTNPVALGKAVDFSSPVGKTLLIGAITYTIRNAQPVGDGATVSLELETP